MILFKEQNLKILHWILLWIKIKILNNNKDLHKKEIPYSFLWVQSQLMLVTILFVQFEPELNN